MRLKIASAGWFTWRSNGT